ncbi:unnamed protein product [Pleuronectes platessa]|uniref:Uncharacterized protein n=1 Tax=Pleuronectes platessa TaxID=8262 RepID=A0A9N7YZM5_PLEPL|nr:unnamed protein product [Pleuronectes platessa]
MMCGVDDMPQDDVRRTMMCSARGSALQDDVRRARVMMCPQEDHCAHRPAAHIIVRRASSCGALHPRAHIGTLRPAAHIVLRHTSSSCGALHPHHPAAHIKGGGLDLLELEAKAGSHFSRCAH